MKYRRCIGITSPIAVQNADNFAMKISNNLVRSVRYWPLGTGLQVDLICAAEGELIVMLTQLGDDYPDWLDDVVDIIEDIGEVNVFTKKYRAELLRLVSPTEAFELLPASEITHFHAADFLANTNQSHFEYEMLAQDETEQLNSSYLRTRTVIPQARLIDTAELARKIATHPGLRISTTLAPVSEDRADEVRIQAFNADQSLQGTMDANASVVDIRCIISSSNAVPAGIKRVVSHMASDSALSELSAEEIKQIIKHPLCSIQGFSRISLTATAFIRLPALELSVVRQAQNAIRSRENAEKATQKFLDDLKNDLKNDIEQDILQKLESRLFSSFSEELEKRLIPAESQAQPKMLDKV